MNTYSYVAKDSLGKVKKGSISVEKIDDLYEIMNEKGLFLINYKETGEEQTKSLYKFNTKELSFNCRQLSAMLTSGLTLVKALDILYKEQEKKGAKESWRTIYEEVQKGQSFSEALRSQKGAFPNFFISMVGAGESSGTLDSVTTRLSDHYAKENKMNNKLKGALTYPIVLLVLSLAIVIGMFTFIMPTFFKLFNGAEMPPLTKVLLGISTFFKSKWYIVIIILIAIVAAIFYLLKYPSTRLKYDEHLIHSKLIGKLVVKIYTGRFSRTLSSLYSSGIPMVECLERSSAVLGNSYITEKFITIIEEVKQGDSLSASLQRADIFESMFCSIVFVGEESGALDEILSKTADYYEEESDSAISKLVSLINPIMIIFLGVMIGLVLAGIFPAMTAMYQNIA